MFLMSNFIIFLQKEKEAKRFRKKGLPQFEKLNEIFGPSTATGDLAISPLQAATIAREKLIGPSPPSSIGQGQSAIGLKESSGSYDEMNRMSSEPNQPTVTEKVRGKKRKSTASEAALERIRVALEEQIEKDQASRLERNGSMYIRHEVHLCSYWI